MGREIHGRDGKRNIHAARGEIGREGKEKSTLQEKISTESRDGDGKRGGREIHVKGVRFIV